ncbi:transcriptional regulator [Clostridium sp. CAG:715]|nr:transcriptional regulator [Clostridium sp. CAG:715]
MNDSEYLRKIGLKLKIYRSLKGYSQDDIVSKLDVDKSYYSKVERGLTNPTLLYLKHVSEILDVNLSDLVDSSISL